MTYSEYKKSIEDEFGECQILHANYDHDLKNCGKTGDRNAPLNLYWIDYWRAMTGNHSNMLYCSSCGKEIFNGKPTAIQKWKFSQGDDTVDKHKAHGGHVWIKSPKDKSYIGGRYITPLCPNCNGQHGKDITIKQGSVYCKELGATRKDE